MLKIRNRYTFSWPLSPVERIPERRPATWAHHEGPPAIVRTLPGIVIGPPGSRVTYECYTLAIHELHAGDITADALERGFTQERFRIDYYVHMRHGGGDEYFAISDFVAEQMPAFYALSDRALYTLIYGLWQGVTVGYRVGCETEHAELLDAFADGRVKVRKVRNQSTKRVTIEPRRP